MALLLSLAAARPHAAGSRQDEITLTVTAVLTVLVFVLLIVGKIVYDRIKYRRVHDGQSLSKRRRVLRSGIAANAKILSSVRLEEPTTNDGHEGTSYYSIVYEVVTHGDVTFRAKGVEEMYRRFNSSFGVPRIELQPGETVAVRYDPVDHTVVLVDPDQKYDEALRHEAEARKAKENEKQEKRRAAEENEARLLRGDRP